MSCTAEPPVYNSSEMFWMCWISYLCAGHLHNFCVHGTVLCEADEMPLTILVASYPYRNSPARNTMQGKNTEDKFFHSGTVIT